MSHIAPSEKNNMDNTENKEFAPENRFRKHIKSVILAVSLSTASGCAGKINNVKNPTNIEQVNQSVKDGMLKELGASYEGAQMDDSSITFGVGEYSEARKKAIDRGRKELYLKDSDKIKVIDIVDRSAGESNGEDRYILCIKIKKDSSDSASPTKTTSIKRVSPIIPSPYKGLTSAPSSSYIPKEFVPTTPSKPIIQPQKKEVQTISEREFQLAIQNTITGIKKYRIAGLYNRYIVKSQSLLHKKAPEDTFSIKLGINQDGKVKKISFRGLSHKLTKLNFDRIIKNYAKAWRFPMNPDRKSYDVKINNITLISPDVEKNR